MYKPSGMTVVTAGLGALALFGIVWSHDTKRAEPWPQPRLPTPVPGAGAALDFGTAFLLNSGAWRAWPVAAEEASAPAQTPMSGAFVSSPAPAEQAPAEAGVELAAPEAPAAVPAEPLPARRVPVQQISGSETPPPPQPLQARAHDQPSEPSTRPTDAASAAPTPPPPSGRMALSGPDAEAARPAAGNLSHVGRRTPTALAAPRAPDRNPEPEAAPPSVIKFGPEALNRFVDRNGF